MKEQTSLDVLFNFLDNNFWAGIIVIVVMFVVFNIALLWWNIRKENQFYRDYYKEQASK